jgi:hypothetical protein
MQDIAGFNLQCTANDVQIASATDIVVLDDGCAFPGDTVDFEAVFEVVVTAKERFDIGLYFATDGDSNNDGAISGVCSVSTPDYRGPDFLDLDGTSNDPAGLIQDTCGDINKDMNPLYPRIQLMGVACADNDNNGMLDLPNCTSWRQSGSNELCTDPSVDAFPGSPSKCNCDQAFNIAIAVPPAQLQVTKTALITSVVEPGGLVTFRVDLLNPGIDPSNWLDVNSMMDNIYGDITQVQGDITSTNCSVPMRLSGNNGSSSCTFTARVDGNADYVHVNTVTASGTDMRGNVLEGSDDATVTVVGASPSINLVKTASPTEVLEPGANVTFTVSITNTSTSSSDPVTITSLIDDIHGNLDGQGDCAVPWTIQPAATETCSFTVFVGGPAGSSETDIVIASGTDDDGAAVSGSDSATVVTNDSPSSIRISKTASPDSVEEPGGDVTFTFSIDNLSAVDSVTIDSLMDSIYGDLDGQGTCAVPQTIVAGGNYTCSFTTYVAGNASPPEQAFETNVVTASGMDDDGNAVSATDDATVNFQDVDPAAMLMVSVSMVVATFEVSVTNDSTAEDLTLDALTDDVYGDITMVQGNVLSTTCSVPQTLMPSGFSNDTYTCSFEARVVESPQTNTTSGEVSDDEGGVLPLSNDATISFD